MKRQVRPLWLLLDSTWRRRAPAKDPVQYYGRSFLWLLTSRVEIEAAKQRRASCSGCRKFRCFCYLNVPGRPVSEAQVVRNDSHPSPSAHSQYPRTAEKSTVANFLSWTTFVKSE
eukprot:s7326_g5.t1